MIGIQSFTFKLFRSQRLLSSMHTASVTAREVAVRHAIAAVCKVITNPTGNGSMNVYSTL